MAMRPLSRGARRRVGRRSLHDRGRAFPERRGGEPQAWSPPAPSEAATRAGCACSATRSAAGAAGRCPTRRRGRRAAAAHERSSGRPPAARPRQRSCPGRLRTRQLEAGEMWNSESVIAVADRHGGGRADDHLRAHRPSRAPGSRARTCGEAGRPTAEVNSEIRELPGRRVVVLADAGGSRGSRARRCARARLATCSRRPPTRSCCSAVRLAADGRDTSEPEIAPGGRRAAGARAASPTPRRSARSRPAPEIALGHGAARSCGWRCGWRPDMAMIASRPITITDGQDPRRGPRRQLVRTGSSTASWRAGSTCRRASHPEDAARGAGRPGCS